MGTCSPTFDREGLRRSVQAKIHKEKIGEYWSGPFDGKIGGRKPRGEGLATRKRMGCASCKDSVQEELRLLADLRGFDVLAARDVASLEVSSPHVHHLKKHGEQAAMTKTPFI